jgi:hypothetical protein
LYCCTCRDSVASAASGGCVVVGGGVATDEGDPVDGAGVVSSGVSGVASTFLRRGLPDDAEGMLKKCPSIKDFTDNDFLDSKNPRFSGSI